MRGENPKTGYPYRTYTLLKLGEDTEERGQKKRRAKKHEKRKHLSGK